jgi:hypothetical protein
MTIQEAKEILLLYRPGTADWQDPEVAEAIALARQEPDLAHWFEEHQAFQTAVRAKFREIETPENLKNLVKLASSRVTPLPVPVQQPAWWQTPAWLAAAAVVVLLIGLNVLRLQPPHPDRLLNYERMMVSTALRGYNMDYATNDMRQLRLYLAAKGAPADYQVGPGLSHLRLLGGSALTWRTNPVAMVCFDRPDKQKVWLFIIDRSHVKDPPTAAPAETTISTLMTASWTEGGKIYMVAGPAEPGFVNKYL